MDSRYFKKLKVLHITNLKFKSDHFFAMVNCRYHSEILRGDT